VVTNHNRDRVFEVMRSCLQHTFVALTKRAYRIPKDIELPKNMWLGITVCNQEELASKIRFLLDANAATKFISYEPALGPIDLAPYTRNLSWVVCGAETGSGARLANIDWFRKVRDQCLTSSVAFMLRATTKDNRGSLDGRHWNEVPRSGGCNEQESTQVYGVPNMQTEEIRNDITMVLPRVQVQTQEGPQTSARGQEEYEDPVPELRQDV
jgi:protein gp37